MQKADKPSFSGKQSSHQTQRNNKKLTSSGSKQQPICTPLAQQETKSSTKQLGSTDPLLGLENFLKLASVKRTFPECSASLAQRNGLQASWRPQNKKLIG